MSERSRKNPRREPPQVIAIIPAKGGSRSIPYKNLQKLEGKTLLLWAVEVAFQARGIDLVAVTTEDEKVARHARRYGALVIPEPKKYARPDSDDSGWYRNAVLWLEKQYGWKPELWVNLRPTGPLRTPKDVDSCIKYVKRKKCDGLKTVVPSPIPPYKMWTREKDGSMRPLLKHGYRRQHGPDIPRQRAQKIFPTYWQDAQIDITKRRFILSKEAEKYGNCFGPNIHGYVMDERKVVDIDTPADLHRAAKIKKQLNNQGNNKKRKKSAEKK